MSAALALPPRLDLTQARELARSLSVPDAPEVVDAGAVTQLGGLCLQVLLAAAQQRRRCGLPFRVDPRSAEFDRATALFGIDHAALRGAGP